MRDSFLSVVYLQYVQDKNWSLFRVCLHYVMRRSRFLHYPMRSRTNWLRCRGARLGHRRRCSSSSNRLRLLSFFALSDQQLEDPSETQRPGLGALSAEQPEHTSPAQTSVSQRHVRRRRKKKADPDFLY